MHRLVRTISPLVVSLAVITTMLSVGALTPLDHAVAAGAKSPSPRIGVGMTSDGSRGEVVLFGGYQIDGTYLNDTWTWHGATWTQEHPDTSPSARYDPGLVYDAARGEVVLFGGADANFNPLADTWTWDGTTWTELHPPISPSSRFWAGMTYDTTRSEVVLFGGYDGSVLNDTWTWDGVTWTEQHPATSPSARYVAGMADDAAHGQVTLFGGVTWAEQHPATSPSARYVAGMADDAAHGQVRLFGGVTTDSETWTWDGTNWTQQHPVTSPTGRYAMGMTYDAARSEVLLFGGELADCQCFLADTWTWNGTTWTEEHPATSPAPRSIPGMTFDTTRSEVVLFGGLYGPPSGGWLQGDTWAWDGTTWRVPLVAHLHLSPTSGPPGTAVMLKGTGFAAVERLTVRFIDSVTGKSVLQILKTDTTGAFTTQVTVPADATAGAQRITASGWRSGQHAKAKFTVT